jgi:hypothetical protein
MLLSYCVTSKFRSDKKQKNYRTFRHVKFVRRINYLLHTWWRSPSFWLALNGRASNSVVSKNEEWSERVIFWCRLLWGNPRKTSVKEDCFCARIGTRGHPSAKIECCSLDCDVVDSYTSRRVCKYFRVLHVNIIGFSMSCWNGMWNIVSCYWTGRAE